MACCDLNAKGKLCDCNTPMSFNKEVEYQKQMMKYFKDFEGKKTQVKGPGLPSPGTFFPQPSYYGDVSSTKITPDRLQKLFLLAEYTDELIEMMQWWRRIKELQGDGK